ncbi:MAG TPA: flavodoxin family protein [Clostridiaceae bacterium]|nr:flavodoxin family protein [Clostridiaceae bacterium]
MVIAIYGSPRKGGNSDILMDAFLSGVKEHENVISYKLRDMTLKPCTGCGFCDDTGVCIYKDDIWKIYEHLYEACGLVLSSPIYFASVTAQLKAFIDRGQAFWVRNNLLKAEKIYPYDINQSSLDTNNIIKKGFYISVGAMNTDKYFLNSRLVVRSFFISVGFKPSGELFFPGIDTKGEIKKYPEALDAAYKAGVEFGKK